MTEFERRKAEIDTVMAEYEQDVAAAVRWYLEWKAKQPKGFRIKRNAYQQSGS